MPTLSVIIPTFNRAHLLVDTIRSARKGGTDLEIIVVDDGSTDATPDICRQAGDLRYVRLAENSGPSHARNTGIRESRADLVAFLDDDDLRLPGTFDRQVAILLDTPDAALVHAPAFVGDSRFGLPTGRIRPELCLRGDIFWQLLEANPIVTSTVVARKAALERAGLFDTNLEAMEDYDLWARVASDHPIEALDEPVIVYRGRSLASGQITSNRAAFEASRRHLLEKLFSMPRAKAAPASVRRRARRRHMSVTLNSLVEDAAEALVEGDARAARACLWTAIRHDPFHLKAHASLLSLLCRSLVERLG